MLPKIWKKLLLAICIIAVLFNITSKLVNRISLEKTISSAPEGIDVKELLNIVEEEPVTEQSTISTYNTVTESSTQEETIQNEETVVNENEGNSIEGTGNGETIPVEENQESSNGNGMFDITDITDFTTLLY